MLTIRPEVEGDHAAVERLVARAFRSRYEARLVKNIRSRGHAVISLVAEKNGVLAGYITFSTVTIVTNGSRWTGIGLGPLAVAPAFQGQGIGSRLVKSGLKECRRLGFERVTVLGFPTYYPRFGFVPAGRYHLRYEGAAPARYFMARELKPRALAGVRGVVHYQPEFQAPE